MRSSKRLSLEELAPYIWSGEPAASVAGLSNNPAADAAGSPLSNNPAADAAGSPLNWREIYGNDHPVEIEVGCGKGAFLLAVAMARPEINFFGIEIVRKYQLYATTRFAIRKLPNVKTVCADARWVFRQFVPPGSVAAVHVYFPDPWWKARHKKRRVFTPGFAADAARVLREGGRLLIATDVEEYFGVMTGIVRAMPAFREVRAETSTAPVEEAGYQTNFERKARQKGTPVWRAEFERTAGPVTKATDPAG
jgi:tRNA (guanine-N7-)-methyltransferase